MNDDIEFRKNRNGETERTCPECGEWAIADHVDVGPGLIQSGPYVCEACGWVEKKCD